MTPLCIKYNPHLAIKIIKSTIYHTKSYIIYRIKWFRTELWLFILTTVKGYQSIKIDKIAHLERNDRTNLIDHYNYMASQNKNCLL